MTACHRCRGQVYRDREGDLCCFGCGPLPLPRAESEALRERLKAEDAMPRVPGKVHRPGMTANLTVDTLANRRALDQLAAEYGDLPRDVWDAAVRNVKGGSMRAFAHELAARRQQRFEVMA